MSRHSHNVPPRSRCRIARRERQGQGQLRIHSESCFNVCAAGRVDRRTAMSSGHRLHSSAATSRAFVAAWRSIARRSIAHADRAQVRCGSCFLTCRSAPKGRSICHKAACVPGSQPRPASIIARSTAHRPETRRERAHFAARTRRNFLSFRGQTTIFSLRTRPNIISGLRRSS